MPQKKKEEITSSEIPSKYTLIAADLSLKRPGFCKIKIERINEEAQIKSIDFLSIDNKQKTKPRGQILGEILLSFIAFIEEDKTDVYFVREQQVNTFAGKGHYSAAAKSGVSSVVGIMDYAAWMCCSQQWNEIFPVTVKKLLTGSGKAEKQDVALAVESHIGKQDFKNDDESDAAAVALAWLLQHNQIKSNAQEDLPNE